MTLLHTLVRSLVQDLLSREVHEILKRSRKGIVEHRSDEPGFLLKFRRTGLAYLSKMQLLNDQFFLV